MAMRVVPEDRTWYLNALEPLGLRVILAEYPGYGGREGTPSQASLVADGRETVRLARAAFGEPLWVWGESLGAAVAAQVAVAPERPARGLVLITPWDNLPDLAQALYWYLPARWLVRDRYDTRAALQTFQGPKAVLIAGQDQIVPPAHSQSLYAALPEPKRLWLFPEAGHNDWSAYAVAWWGETVAWLEAQASQAANTSTIK
jgi:pimeloyl-ACP methyl ester carboxylesterase